MTNLHQYTSALCLRSKWTTSTCPSFGAIAKGHSASQKVNLKGSLVATSGEKGEKRDVMSPIPSKPVIEKKTREGSSDDRNDTCAGIEEDTIEINEPVTDPSSPSHAHVFLIPMHPDDILQIAIELRALMLPEIKPSITKNMPDTKSIVYDAMKNATTPLTEKSTKWCQKCHTE